MKIIIIIVIVFVQLRSYREDVKDEWEQGFIGWKLFP